MMKFCNVSQFLKVKAEHWVTTVSHRLNDSLFTTCCLHGCAGGLLSLPVSLGIRVIHRRHWGVPGIRDGICNAGDLPSLLDDFSFMPHDILGGDQPLSMNRLEHGCAKVNSLVNVWNLVLAMPAATFSAYHMLNFPLSSCLYLLFTVASKGCNRSVHAAGTYTRRAPICLMRSHTSSHVWARKTSQMSGGEAVSRCCCMRVTYGCMTVSRKRSIEPLVDQWNSVCQTSQSSGKSVFGWHLSVFPWYRTWGVKKSPANEQARRTVYCLLSSMPFNGTWRTPFCSSVHSPTGTMLTPVWSQLIMSSSGISCCLTWRPILRQNFPPTSLKSSGLVLMPLVPFCLANPIRLRRDLAHVLSKVTWPPCSAKIGGFLFLRSPLVPASTTLDETAPPACRMPRMYAFTSSSYLPSNRSRPRSLRGSSLISAWGLLLITLM